MVVMTIAILAATGQSILPRKNRVIKRSHIVIERAHCRNILLQTQSVHKIANSACVKRRSILIDRFAVLNGKFPGIRIGIFLAFLRLRFKLFPTLYGIGLAFF